MIENPSMQFDETLREVEIRERAGSNPVVKDIVYDSRQALPGCGIRCHAGWHDGWQSLRRKGSQQGAIAVMTDSEAAWQGLSR